MVNICNTYIYYYSEIISTPSLHTRRFASESVAIFLKVRDSFIPTLFVRADKKCNDTFPGYAIIVLYVVSINSLSVIGFQSSVFLQTLVSKIFEIHILDISLDLDYVRYVCHLLILFLLLICNLARDLSLHTYQLLHSKVLLREL